jgi:squalene cyclase
MIRVGSDNHRLVIGWDGSWIRRLLEEDSLAQNMIAIYGPGHAYPDGDLRHAAADRRVERIDRTP